MSNEMTKRQRLQTVLERHGARPANWPREDRQLVEFTQEDGEAELMFRQAKALDHLLDLSAVGTVAAAEQANSLQQDILADFDRLQLGQGGTVIAFGQQKKPVHVGAIDHAGWATAMALAACFAFGIYLGGFGVGDWTLDLAASFETLSGGNDRLAGITDYVMSSGLEEDLL